MPMYGPSFVTIVSLVVDWALLGRSLAMRTTDGLR